MVAITKKDATHPNDTALADYLQGILPPDEKKAVEAHLACCDECLADVVSAHEAVREFRKDKKGRADFMKKINIYLVLAILSFILSFITPRYFLQLLLATALLGIKWIVDSKTTRMLVTIYDAWKSGGEPGTKRMMEKLDKSLRRKF